MGDNYDASVEALRGYSPTPDIKASVRLKGAIPEEILKEIVEFAYEHDIEDADRDMG